MKKEISHLVYDRQYFTYADLTLLWDKMGDEGKGESTQFSFHQRVDLSGNPYELYAQWECK